MREGRIAIEAEEEPRRAQGNQEKAMESDREAAEKSRKMKAKAGASDKEKVCVRYF